jgi:hypothetical protein
MTQKELKAELKWLLQEKAKLDERIKNCKKYIIFKPKKYDLDKISWCSVPHGLYQIKFKKSAYKIKYSPFEHYFDREYIIIGDSEDDYTYARTNYFQLRNFEKSDGSGYFERENLNNCCIYTIEGQYYHKRD